MPGFACKSWPLIVRRRALPAVKRTIKAQIAILIRQGLSQGDPLVQLNGTAIAQMKSLVGASLEKRLK